MTCRCVQTDLGAIVMEPLRGGLGTIVMEPLRGGLAQGGGAGLGANAAQMYAMGGVFAPAAAMAGAGLYGGAVGGLSSGKWAGAGTGALLTAGLTGTLGGIGAMTFGGINPEAITIAEPGTTGVGLTVAGAVYAAVGIGLLVWGGIRAYRTVKRRSA